jgi:hypothetical protein
MLLPDTMPLWLSLLLALVVAPALALTALALVQALADRLLRHHGAPVLKHLLTDGRGGLRVAAGLLAAMAAVPELEMPGPLARALVQVAGLASSGRWAGP